MRALAGVVVLAVVLGGCGGVDRVDVGQDTSDLVEPTPVPGGPTAGDIPVSVPGAVGPQPASNPDRVGAAVPIAAGIAATGPWGVWAYRLKDGSLCLEYVGGNSGGAALYDGRLVAIPTRVSLKTDKGSDFGYLHPITWAAQVFAYASLRYGLAVPALDLSWIESSHNTDVARTTSYGGGHIVSGQSRLPVTGDAAGMSSRRRPSYPIGGGGLRGSADRGGQRRILVGRRRWRDLRRVEQLDEPGADGEHGIEQDRDPAPSDRDSRVDVDQPREIASEQRDHAPNITRLMTRPIIDGWTRAGSRIAMIFA
jgi:hypothetical protein